MSKRVRTMGLLAAGLGVFLAGTVEAQGPDSRLERQIGVMERILDEVMVESPNLLVHSSEPSHGLYLDEFGVLFVISASFTSDYGDWKNLSFGGYSIEHDDEGDVIILKKKGDKADEDEDVDISWQDIQDKRHTEQYAAGKQELVDAILDYGETLSALQGSQWVAVALFLEDYEYMGKGGGMSRLVIKARMEDLRSLSTERLSREAMVKKLSIEEY